MYLIPLIATRALLDFSPERRELHVRQLQVLVLRPLLEDTDQQCLGIRMRVSLFAFARCIATAPVV